MRVLGTQACDAAAPPGRPGARLRSPGAADCPDFPDDDARWRAVLRRDRSADNAFCYSVLTTGTYSRPSCGSRHAQRANTLFFPSPAAAEKAGFRPCRRCRPDQKSRDTRVDVVVQACRLIESPAPTPSLGDLAAATGFSRFHFHRVFTSLTGVTPKAYATACRADRLRRSILRTRTITEAIYEAGFNSSGNFYALAQKLLGMTPTAYKNSGQGEHIRHSLVECDLGLLLVAATPTGLCAVDSGPEAAPLLRRLRTQFDRSVVTTAGRRFERRLDSLLPGAAPLKGDRSLPEGIRSRALREWLRTELGEEKTLFTED